MKYLTGLIFLVLASTSAIADHHALNLEARQPRSDSEITSIQLGEDLSVLTTESTSGLYGKVYITYHMSYDRDGSGGSYKMQGRGYVDANTLFSGSGAGRWWRDGHLVRMAGVTSVSGGSQNLEIRVADLLNRTLTSDVYALSN